MIYIQYASVYAVITTFQPTDRKIEFFLEIANVCWLLVLFCIQDVFVLEVFINKIKNTSDFYRVAHRKFIQNPR